jgi:hypothetical protein
MLSVHIRARQLRGSSAPAGSGRYVGDLSHPAHDFHNNLNSTLCRPGKPTRTARVRVVVAPMSQAQSC